MKKQRVVQMLKQDLKGKGRKSTNELMDDIKRALARRGIKGKK